MRLIFVIFSILFTSAVCDYALQHIGAIEGQISALEFNANGEAYVGTFTNDTRRLYKLNQAKKILWTINTKDFFAHKIVINNLSDVYVQFRTEYYELHLSILREETLTFEKIDDVYESLIFIHENSNVFYNGNDGIKFLRPNSVNPVLIKNLENYFYLQDGNFVVDSKGNIYLGVLDFNDTTSSFAVVTKESLSQQKVPEAVRYQLDPGFTLDGLIIDQNDDLWVFTSDSVAISQIKKFTNGNLIDILFDEVYENHMGLAVKDRVYVVSMTFNHLTAPTYFLTLDGNVHQIGGLDQVKTDTLFNVNLIADKDGNFYFGAYYPFSNGPLALVRPNENKATWINFPELLDIGSMVLDENDDLWIETMDGGVFYLKKGETTAVKVSAPDWADKDLIKGIVVNKITNEVFVFGGEGLYFVTDKSL